MTRASGPVTGADPLWTQNNTAAGNGTVFGVQGGNIIVHPAGAGNPPQQLGHPPRGPGEADDRIRILFLAANPRSTSRLALDEEAREISEKLRLSRDRDAFELITCWAVRRADLLQYINQHRPQIVHFSGHGGRTGEIMLAAGDGTDRRVGAAALAELFRILRDEIRVVVLNACYSASQAQAIGQHVDYVVSMRAAINDDAATVFAAAFYSALGFRRTVPQSFQQATAALMLHGLPDHDIPELLVRSGADPDVMVGG